VLENLLTEQSNPATANLDALSTVELLRALNAEDARVAVAVAAEIASIADAVDAISERVAAGGRLFYIGAGTSGRLATLDAAEIPPTFGADPDLVQAVIAGGPTALTRSVEGAEDDLASGRADLETRGFGAADALVGVAASGRTPYVVGALRWAREIGALTVALSTNPESEVGHCAEISISPIVGPEAIAGSTRLKSGTAQKMVLNMLSTGLMVRRGAVYGNLMVNVQLTNEKLRDRGDRIVRRIAGCDSATARAALEASGDVRTAIVMILRGCDAELAGRRLREAGGVLRRALTSEQ
jgi:N-acetylmuramic acid 6-phosphate etherase